jgi:L-arabinonolactonase
MSALRAECALECRNILGEGPIWDWRDSRLYWVDIRAPALLSLDPASGRTERWPMPAAIGCAVPRESGGWIVALRDGIHGFDPATGVLTRLATPEPERPENRLNDGKCDRLGRFWVGSMREGSREPAGALYRLDPDLRCHRILAAINVPNSIAWSTDDRTFYFADTRADSIQAFAYDLSAGGLGAGHIFAGPGAAPGRPDGATVDAEGCLWSARWGGSVVARFAPDGRLDRIVPLPVSQVTACAFGGPGLATLFVTSASIHLSSAELAEQPLAGGLFAIDVGVRGIAETPFAG